MVFPTELEAFRAYAASFPENVTLLIDTYDVLQGARNSAVVAKEMDSAGHRLSAVRIDSGDLADLSLKVRAILDCEGLDYVKIIGTSDLNEYKISELVAKKAKIDAYGVGTELITGKPVDALPGVYKLVQIDDRPVIKLSSDKVTYPGIKQVYRLIDGQGHYEEDLLALESEKVQDCLSGESKDRASNNDLGAFPMLSHVVSKGRRTLPRKSIHETQRYVEEGVSKLHNTSLRIIAPSPYASRPSPKLIELTKNLRGLYKIP
jgi:nicotinate phosphoribosyltransferase